VHWPFCASKCPYCDFNSHVRAGGIDADRFLRAYLAELAFWAQRSPGPAVRSVFFGGGTPSLMQPAAVGAILSAIAAHWPMEAATEITLEANPSSAETDRLRDYAAAGVNRLSLGVQSLDDAQLKRLGRLHSVAEARAAIAAARRTFARVSFDLIYARPEQQLAAWREELAAALALACGHLSLYQLTIEAGTPFAALAAAGKLVPMANDAAHAFYELTQEMTERVGLPQYEISNHAAAGEECRHNLLYWRYGTYLGIGAGAHGRVLLEGRRHATATERQPERWLGRVEREGSGVTEITPLTAAEQADEMLLMGLRLAEGLDLARLLALTGRRPRDDALRRLTEAGLIEVARPDRVRASARGRVLLNELIRQLAMAMVEAPASRAASAPCHRSASVEVS
jgi:oxygen-independent coproporphyrinogen-3 oxidase